MVGIYKIENKINGKVYIGQSVSIERRWKEHCKPSSSSVISNAIKEYGKDNFTFEILEECLIEDLDAKEEKYIHKFNCLVPKGYNVSDSINGNITSYKHYSPEILQHIIDDLEECKLTMAEIAKKYSINVSTVSRINSGKIHLQEGRVYPIRNSLPTLRVKDESIKILRTKNKLKQNYCCDCGKTITHNATRCPECCRINQRTVKRPTREELKKLIRTESFVKIGKMFNVSDNAIRKWCKMYDLPFRVKDIKIYSDEEWNKI